MKNSIILVLIDRDTRFCHEKDAQNVVTGWFFTKNGQNDVTQVKLFIMNVKSLLEVHNTNNSEFGCPV